MGNTKLVSILVIFLLSIILFIYFINIEKQKNMIAGTYVFVKSDLVLNNCDSLFFNGLKVNIYTNDSFLITKKLKFIGDSLGIWDYETNGLDEVIILRFSNNKVIHFYPNGGKRQLESIAFCYPFVLDKNYSNFGWLEFNRIE